MSVRNHPNPTRIPGLTRSLGLVGLILIGPTQAGWFINQEQEAERQFRQGDYADAANEFSDPYRRGVALYRAGRHVEAADAFAREQRPEVAEDATYNLGNARFQVGDFTGAVAAYEQVLGQNPDHADARHNLSLARAVLARIDQEKFEREKREREAAERQERERQEEERRQREAQQEQQRQEQQQQAQQEQ
ncbi:MAG: tetratricopeptide repeat protein, partial [Chromatiaceae bacterium]|nr:tetratricopeptide repeat protein [Candidatus Thioaporhodococcus sediminis]